MPKKLRKCSNCCGNFSTLYAISGGLCYWCYMHKYKKK